MLQVTIFLLEKTVLTFISLELNTVTTDYQSREVPDTHLISISRYLIFNININSDFRKLKLLLL